MPRVPQPHDPASHSFGSPPRDFQLRSKGSLGCVNPSLPQQAGGWGIFSPGPLLRRGSLLERCHGQSPAVSGRPAEPARALLPKLGHRVRQSTCFEAPSILSTKEAGAVVEHRGGREGAMPSHVLPRSLLLSGWLAESPCLIPSCLNHWFWGFPEAELGLTVGCGEGPVERPLCPVHLLRSPSRRE